MTTRTHLCFLFVIVFRFFDRAEKHNTMWKCFLPHTHEYVSAIFLLSTGWNGNFGIFFYFSEDRKNNR